MNVPKSRPRDDTKDMFISGAKVIVVSKYPRLLVKYSIGVSFLPALVDLLLDSCWKIVYFRHPPNRLQARLINKGNACGNVGKCETFVTTLRCLCISLQSSMKLSRNSKRNRAKLPFLYTIQSWIWKKMKENVNIDASNIHIFVKREKRRYVCSEFDFFQPTSVTVYVTGGGSQLEHY